MELERKRQLELQKAAEQVARTGLAGQYTRGEPGTIGRCKSWSGLVFRSAGRTNVIGCYV